ncbi:Site-specific recombinase XerD [Bacteroidales bacterium Barb6XT]|nr:Site-specific recombinase XerD [Bacteroidales bacterium Barb6XT]
MVTKFQKFLEKSDLSKSTVTSYVWTINHFLTQYEKIDKENLLAYKGYLIEHFKPQTVNLRLQALNKYLEFISKERLKLKFVKVQQKTSSKMLSAMQITSS